MIFMKANLLLALVVFVLAFFVFSCPVAGQGAMTVKVDYILQIGDSSEVWVKRRAKYNNPGYIYYVAKFGAVPDSIKVGATLTLSPANTACNGVIFRHWNKKRRK
jgi:hypothetical protein